MTDPSGTYWNRVPGSYRQPRVIETPLTQNANNARHAVWHLGRELVIEVYPSLEGWRAGNLDAVDDGRHDPGEPALVTIRGVVQPLGSGSSTVSQAFEGERTEGQIVLHVDSNEPFNIDAAAANPTLFQGGAIRIIGPDMRAPDDRFNHATVLRFRGRRWKVLQVMELFEGGDEDLHVESAIYRAVCGLYQDHSHERDAKPADFVSAWGPE